MSDVLFSDVIDNRSQELRDHVREYLRRSSHADLAVGYFFLSGFEAVRDAIRPDGTVRLLIGNTTDRPTIEALARGYRRLEEAQERARQDDLRDRRPQHRDAVTESSAMAARSTLEGMDGTSAELTAVEELARLIESGRLRVRVYTRDGGVLHAKAYIFDSADAHPGQPGAAIVGSSNLSISGLSRNSELNVVVHGAAYHAHLKGWFERLWLESEDFEATLLAELRASWALALVTPRELYLKALYHLVEDRLDDAQKLDEVWSAHLPPLTSFQRVAVNQAIRMLDDWNGVIVGDVVGLGKSFIGAGLLSYHRRVRGQRALIVCPAPLVSMWEELNDTYELGATVLGMTELPRLADELLVSDRYRSREIVLIDESHNFRNSATARYGALRAFMERGRPRAILLTATPQNNSAFDILHQVQLFHPEEATLLPIDPPELSRFVGLVNRGERQLPDLLRPIFIRRTRAHVERFFPDAVLPATGEKIVFPRRELRTVDYNIAAVYEGGYEEIARELGGLSYAKYALYDYVRPERLEREPYRSLKGSGRSFRGIMASMLFKRFESSVEAFRQTLGRLVSLHAAFLLALDGGKIAVGNEAQALLSEAGQLDDPALFDALERMDARYRIEDFDVPRLRLAVADDLRALTRLAARVQGIGPDRDDKLRTLRSLVLRLRAEGKKVLVFTQFADTAAYLYENLRDVPDLERVYSGQGVRARLIGRFSPRSARYRLASGETELQVLIATDVLSEGLNLQDASALVNYDLHWNPVRLIQRAGRIDRLGSRNEVVEFHNFLPQPELDRTLGLRDRLRARIDEIHQAIGGDSFILEPTERVNEDAMYAIYSADSDALDALEGGAETFGIEEAEAVVRALRQEEPALFERIRTMPMGVRSGKPGGPGASAFVYCRAGSFGRLYLVGPDGEILTDDLRSAVRQIEADETTPRLPPPPEFGDLVASVRRRFADDVRAREASQRTLRKTPAQRYVLDALAELRPALLDEPDLNHLDALHDVFARHWGTGVERRLRRIARDRYRDRALVEELGRIATDFNLFTRARDTPAPVEAEFPFVVCAEHLA